MVRVRVVKGQNRSAEYARRPMQSGPLLKDLSKQLEALPFSSYRVIDVKEQPIRFGETGTFELAGAAQETHTISIAPQGRIHRKIQMMVDWHGPQGESLLSSKLRVENGKNVVLGTDSSRDASTMICIHLNCD